MVYHAYCQAIDGCDDDCSTIFDVHLPSLTSACQLNQESLNRLSPHLVLRGNVLGPCQSPCLELQLLPLATSLALVKSEPPVGAELVS